MPHSAPHTSTAILGMVTKKEIFPSGLNFPVNGTEGRNTANLESGSTQLTDTGTLHW